jgi:hypothetical protein
VRRCGDNHGTAFRVVEEINLAGAVIARLRVYPVAAASSGMPAKIVVLGSACLGVQWWTTHPAMVPGIIATALWHHELKPGAWSAGHSGKVDWPV